jgi:hypothetical protein
MLICPSPYTTLVNKFIFDVYYYHSVYTPLGCLFIHEDITNPIVTTHSWWTVYPRGYHHPNSDYSLLVDRLSTRISVEQPEVT